MYEAMAAAPLGDDVLGDDPTVKKLELLAAQMLEKEAALFVPSGTMGNSICLKVQTNSGDEILLEELSHIYAHEMSHLAMVSRVLPRPVKSYRGIMDLDDLQRKISKRSIVTGRTTLISIENTHNFWSGRVVPLDHFRQVRLIARDYGLKIHLDGARLFNAQVATGTPASEYALYADTVMFCLSKGLSAPIGSIIAGTGAMIEEARYVRKMLGGGMRQVGLIAACGIVALETMVDRLADDHRRAKQLAQALAEMPGVTIDPALIDTNIVIFSLNHPKHTAEELVALLWELGIWSLTTSPTEVRFVTHKDITDEDIERAVSALKSLL
jgi:threonine aldolase